MLSLWNCCKGYINIDSLTFMWHCLLLYYHTTSSNKKLLTPTTKHFCTWLLFCSFSDALEFKYGKSTFNNNNFWWHTLYCCLSSWLLQYNGCNPRENDKKKSDLIRKLDSFYCFLNMWPLPVLPHIYKSVTTIIVRNLAAVLFLLPWLRNF